MAKICKSIQKFRAKEELKLKLSKIIMNFKSEEEPKYKISEDDVVNILAGMIKDRIF